MIVPYVSYIMIRKLLSSLDKIKSKRRERAKLRSRSKYWEAVRDRHLEMFPVCAGCGGHDELQVHHIVPFHISPELELVPRNLITLCMGYYDCHLKLGHGGSFRCYNPDIVRDVKIYRESSIGQRLVLLKEIREKRLVD